jgi:hypothetical protein
MHWRTDVKDLQLPQLKQAEITGLRKITVEVRFERGDGSKNLQMSTYVSNRGLL